MNEQPVTEKKRLPFLVILLGIVVAGCVLFSVVNMAIDALGFRPTSTPTLMATFTPTLTGTATSTSTLSPTETSLPTSTETPQPTITAMPTETRPANCIAAYPDFCIQPGTRQSCDDIGRHDFTVLPPDPFGYDGDDDGIGCES